MGISDIFNENSLIKIRLVIYGILIFLSFFIFVGVSVMMEKSSDKCPLYGEMTGRFLVFNGAKSNCDYPIAISVIFQLVFLLIRMVTLILVLIGKLSKESFLFSDLMQFVYVLIDLVAFFLTFVAACILTAGSQEFLDSPYIFKFETASKVSQGGAWTSTILWLIVGLIGLLVAWTSGKVPCVGGRRQDSQSKEGQNQAEMVDPASERFGV